MIKIYRKYEELINYTLFLNEIKNSEIIKKSNFYFGMFNSLTTQGKNIIKEICKYAKSVSFACAKTQSRVNNNEILLLCSYSYVKYISKIRKERHEPF